MKLTVKKQIGQQFYDFSFEGEGIFDLFEQSQQVSFNNIYTCPVCGCKYLDIRARRTGQNKEFKYLSVNCLDQKCGASCTFGLKKDGKTYFLRKNEKGEYDWKRVPHKEVANKVKADDPFESNFDIDKIGF